jgi:hypothetical protein
MAAASIVCWFFCWWRRQIWLAKEEKAKRKAGGGPVLAHLPARYLMAPACGITAQKASANYAGVRGAAGFGVPQHARLVPSRSNGEHAQPSRLSASGVASAVSGAVSAP